MTVQYKAVSRIPTLHIVLYCLTPPLFGRYSSFNLCPPYPAWGVASGCSDGECNRLGGRGIRLVNTSDLYENPYFWQNRPALGHPSPTSRNSGETWGTHSTGK